MSGIATILLKRGVKVSGSDISTSKKLDKLSDLGAVVFTGHCAANIPPGTDLVVVSTAIPPSNPELLAAKSRKIEIIHRGEMLARLMAGYKGITVAGAHGKTTITAMIALCLERNGFDPSVAVGGELNAIGGNAKNGHGEFFVAEADESDGSFLKLCPFVAVASNVEDDHLDYYETLDRIAEAFKRYISSTAQEGFAVLCSDDLILREMARLEMVKTVTYGFNPSADYRIGRFYTERYSTQCEIFHREKKLGYMELQVPGRHNMVNALAAVTVCHELGIDFNDVCLALHQFTGVQRRFQLMGKSNGIIVIDDYAHHPTEIKATLNAARQGNPKRIVAVFQPHRFSRTKFLYREFGEALEEADLVIVNDIYSAGESPIFGVSSQLIIQSIRDKGKVCVHYIPDRTATIKFLSENVGSGDVVITMGAGDVWKVGTEFLELYPIANRR